MKICRSFIWFLLRLIVTCIACVILYLLAAISLGLLAVNSDYQATNGEIKIFLTTNGIHSGLLVPAQTQFMDWTKIFPPEQTKSGKSTTNNDAILIGWGDRTFFLTTPTWADLKPSTAILALSGLDSSVLHIEYQSMPTHSSTKKLMLSLTPENYQRLINFILTSTQLDANGQALWIHGYAYGENDAFYEAKGHYSALRTCNEWTRQALCKAKVRTAWWAPFDRALFWQLRDQENISTAQSSISN